MNIVDIISFISLKYIFLPSSIHTYISSLFLFFLYIQYVIQNREPEHMVTASFSILRFFGPQSRVTRFPNEHNVSLIRTAVSRFTGDSCSSTGGVTGIGQYLKYFTRVWELRFKREQRTPLFSRAVAVQSVWFAAYVDYVRRKLRNTPREEFAILPLVKEKEEKKIERKKE